MKLVKVHSHALMIHPKRNLGRRGGFSFQQGDQSLPSRVSNNLTPETNLVANLLIASTAVLALFSIGTPLNGLP
jgi:hypothetical protein